jgi:hypothetical protein
VHFHLLVVVAMTPAQQHHGADREERGDDDLQRAVRNQAEEAAHPDGEPHVHGDAAAIPANTHAGR